MVLPDFFQALSSPVRSASSEVSARKRAGAMSIVTSKMELIDVIAIEIDLHDPPKDRRRTDFEY